MSSSKFASVPQEPLNCDEWLFACFQAFATIRRRQFVIADRWMEERGPERKWRRDVLMRLNSRRARVLAVKVNSA